MTRSSSWRKIGIPACCFSSMFLHGKEGFRIDSDHVTVKTRVFIYITRNVYAQESLVYREDTIQQAIERIDCMRRKKSTDVGRMGDLCKETQAGKKGANRRRPSRVPAGRAVLSFSQFQPRPVQTKCRPQTLGPNVFPGLRARPRPMETPIPSWQSASPKGLA